MNATTTTQNLTSSAIDLFVTNLRQEVRLTQSVVLKIMTDRFGDSASGKWSWKQATDLIEAAFVNRLLTDNFTSLTAIEQLQALVPHHQVRSEEQIQYQQFSTPLALAWIVAQLASPQANDTILEPSAGTGILAAAAINRLNGAKLHQLILNEISPGRKALLKQLFGTETSVSSHNAEYINDFLAPNQKPTLTLINPPFSSSIGNDKRDRECCMKHLRSALLRLQTNGRLVGIFPHWLSPEKYPEYFESLPAKLQLSIYVSGNHYKYHGTTMETRILVFDKTSGGELPKSIDCPTTTSLQLQELAAGNCPQRIAPVTAYSTVNAQIATAIKPAVDDITLDLFAGLPLFQIAPSPQLEISYTPVDRERVPSIAQPIVPIQKYEQFKNLVRLSYRAAVKTPVPMSDEIYTTYRPGIIVDNASPHPSEICESVSMASIDCPLPVVRPTLPENILTDKLASDCQLETLIYAAQSHSKRLDTPWYIADNGQIKVATPDNSAGRYHRQGYYCGFNTGVGKSRTISLLILTNWCEGRKKAVWISANDGKLLEDAKSEWCSVGGRANQIVPLSKFDRHRSISLSEGILFVTYATLRSPATGNKKSRIDQIIEWLGEDWEGCLCFDEAHLMSNASGEKSNRGFKPASAQAIAGTTLANRLPNARVTYFSATGATKASSLSYCQKLGLWQTQAFPFSSRHHFISSIENAGIAGLEMVAKDLKAMGLYLAPSLSFDGVEYETLVHEITAEQREAWDIYTQAFVYIHQQLEAVLRSIGLKTESGQCTNGIARANAMSMFESTKLKFFNTLICATKAPTLIENIERDIAAGHAPVIQLVSTGAASLQRLIAKIPAHEWHNLHEVDFTPTETIIQYLETSFPIHVYQQSQDERGNVKSELMRDEHNNPVVSLEAVANRDAVIDRICTLPPLNGLLDILVWHFGDKISEVTSRTKRIICKNNRYQLETRSEASSIADANAFQNDRTKLLVFSNAGGTGVGYHADPRRQNQRKRRHYLVEAGWTATNAIQGLGRTHRAAETKKPEMILLTTDIRGEQRFLATIGSRLAALGAITRGQRNTGSSMFDEESSNFTSNYAELAMSEFFTDLARGQIEGISIGEFCELTGLDLLNQGGGLLLDGLPKMNTFLNRLLALPIKLQNLLFSEFEQRMEDRIQAAKDNDTYDRGVENLHASCGFEIVESQVLNVHISNAQTICHTIDKLEKYAVTSVAAAQKITAAQNFQGYRHKATHELAIAGNINQSLNINRQPVQTISFINPSSDRQRQFADLPIFQTQWLPVELDTHYWEQWQQQLDAAPKHRKSRFYLVCGLLLPVWDKLPKHAQVYRLETNDGQTLLGKQIHSYQMEEVYKQFGLTDLFQLSPSEIVNMLRAENTAREIGKYQVQRKYYKGVQRLEILAVYGQDNIDRLKAIGCFTENIERRVKVFIPVDNAAAIIERLAKI